MRTTFLVILIVFSSLAYADRQLTTFTLRYANPIQIQPVVQSYLSDGSSVSVYQNQLVVNGTDADLAKTAELISQLDIAGHQLLISIKTSGTSNNREKNLSVSGEVSVGKGIRTESRTAVTVTDYRSRSVADGRQGVRATEGQPAYISIGSSAPITQYRSTSDGRLVRQQSYVSADSGFYATVWLVDDSVRISIDQQRQQFEGRRIDGQQLQSEVTGRRGVWIPIGVIADAKQQDSSGIAHRETLQGSSSETIYIKVEKLK